jgi:uncharacterized protein (TIGR00288 family)
MEIKDRTIALLIDSENISQAYFSVLMEELNHFGDVTYKRIYGDFTKGNGWRQIMLDNAITPIQQFSYTIGKNSSDSAMIIDAMDILHAGNVDCVCLATSDSDFTRLAMRFRENNWIVIGAGEKKAPQSFQSACHRFILLDTLFAEGKEKPKGTPENEKQLIEIAKNIVQNNAEADGQMHFSTFMNELYKKQNTFNPKSYGSTYTRPILFFKELKQNGRPVFTLERGDNFDKIRLNS